MSHPTRQAPALRRLTLIDTSAASTNLGDQIIMEAVRRELSSLLPDAFAFTVASHEWMGRKSRSLMRRSNWVVAGGTSLLSSRMWFRPPWKLAPWDVVGTPGVVLMGAGWYQYQRRPDPYSRWMLRRVLRGAHTHSVRDSHTAGMLRSIGISRVLNTSCPTLWKLSSEHCSRIPAKQAENVVTTLNTYMPDPPRDRRFLEVLCKNFSTVYFWPQTDTDYEYAKQLGSGLRFIDPSLAAYDGLLGSDQSLDYVGLRLHAGIRAMQFARRAVIVEIDNRAQVMGKDVGLITVDRGDFERLQGLVSGSFPTSLQIPWAAIDEWKAQFR